MVKINKEDIMVADWWGNEIRYVRYEDDWWAVLKDVCDALELTKDGTTYRTSPRYLAKASIQVEDGYEDRYIINELGVFDAISRSSVNEVRAFKEWAGRLLIQMRNDTNTED